MSQIGWLWKYAFPAHERQKYQWLHPLSMALTSLKLQAAPFPGGFLASRQAPPRVSGNHFVVSSKKDSCSGLNTTPKWSVMLAVTLVLHLQPRTDCPSPNMPPLPLATPLKANPIPTSRTWWASFRMGLPLSPKQAWRTRNDRIAILPKLKLLVVSRVLSMGSTGLPRKDSHQSTPLQSGLLACSASDVSRFC